MHARVDSDVGQTLDLAVLIKSDEHEPVMSMHKNDFIQDGSTATPRASGNSVCFNLADQVTNSIGAGTAFSIKLVQIPHLDNLRRGGGGVHRAVRNRRHHPNFAAYVELPKLGTLQTEDYFECAVKYDNEDFGCLGRTVIYSVEAAHNVTFTIGSLGTVVVNRDADVWITNLCVKCPGTGDSTCSGAVANPHTDEYAKFFDPPADRIAQVYRNGSCDVGTAKPMIPSCAQPQDLNVDCSNTRFP